MISEIHILWGISIFTIGFIIGMWFLDKKRCNNCTVADNYYIKKALGEIEIS